MEILRAACLDVQAIYRLICLLEDEELFWPDFQQIYLQNLSNPQIAYLLYKNKEDVLGFCSLHIQSLLHHAAKIGEIQELFLHPSARGTGAGCALAETAKQIAKESGCTQIEVCCNMARESSHRFYEHLGFSQSHYKFTMPL